MTTTRTFEKSPATAPLLLKAVLPALPGLGNLPGVRHDGSGSPDLTLVRAGIATDSKHLAAYNAVCGYVPADILPPLYPHMAAFPLHLALMTDTSFPFLPMGTVHVRNTVTQHRPIGVDESFDLTVEATPLRSHRVGRVIDVITRASIDGDVVWEETSTMLSRGKPFDPSTGSGQAPPKDSSPLDGLDAPDGPVQWKLRGDLGRKYGAISGDRNPIHLYPLTAKAFGFPRNIAHGMWSKARSLAALQNRLPERFTAEVEFRKPILLPSTVNFGSRSNDGVITFGVTSARKPATHVVGRVSQQ
jgi:acyl dehydratase